MRRECPDSGWCHHDCKKGCWRVLHAAPLSIAGYPDDRWPKEVVEDNQDQDDVPRVEDLF